MTGPLGEGDPRHAQAVEAAASAVYENTYSTYHRDSAATAIAAYLDSLREQGVVLVEAATKPKKPKRAWIACGGECLDRRRCEREGGCFAQGVVLVEAATKPCEHEWTDARNKVVESGEVCLKCGAVRAGNSVEAATKRDIMDVIRSDEAMQAFGVERPESIAEAATKPCEKCGGTGEESHVVPGCCRDFLPDGQCCGNAIPVEEREACPKCGGSGTVPVVLVDRDALIGEIADELVEEIVEALGVSVRFDEAADFILRHFAPGNREGQ